MGWLNPSGWLNPGVVAFVGAVLVAIGTLWGFQRQSARSAEMAELSKRLADKSDEVARLTKDNLDAVTGGNSFCAILLTDLEDPAGPSVLVHTPGKHPVYDVMIQISDSRLVKDMETFAKQPQPIKGISATEILRRFTEFHPGNVSPSAGRMLGKIPRPISGDREDFNINFFARNGTWAQQYRLRRVQDGWRTATRVIRGKGEPTEVVLFEAIDSGFPRDAAGKVSW